MADDDLVEAERLLEKYAAENKCGWCRKKARNLRDAARQLRQASPKALDLTDKFKEELGDTSALDSVEVELEDIRSQAEKHSRFRERLTEVLDKPRERASQHRSQGSQGAPRRLLDESLPALPRIVTPDDVGLKREEDLRRFREQSNRRTGPIREQIRFRLWQRIGEEEGPLRRNRND